MINKNRRSKENVQVLFLEVKAEKRKGVKSG